MTKCANCPCMCGANRAGNEIGLCGVGNTAYIARAARHYYEEPPISGKRGSGAIFFVGCNMRCVFCQNKSISSPSNSMNEQAIATHKDALAAIMLRLQEIGAHNINLVTPTPHTELIIDATRAAKKEGLKIPIVYNTNGYERVETIERLNGIVDIYLPDLKYVTPALSQKYSGRSDYFEYAAPAVEKMLEQVGGLVTDGDGIAKKGVLIRHLALPAAIDETRRTLDYIASAFPRSTFISLMSQYTPIEGMKKPLDRRITPAEYERAVRYALALGFTNVFIQQRSSAKSRYTPQFDGFIE